MREISIERALKWCITWNSVIFPRQTKWDCLSINISNIKYRIVRTLTREGEKGRCLTGVFRGVNRLCITVCLGSSVSWLEMGVDDGRSNLGSRFSWSVLRLFRRKIQGCFSACEVRGISPLWPAAAANVLSSIRAWSIMTQYGYIFSWKSNRPIYNYIYNTMQTVSWNYLLSNIENTIPALQTWKELLLPKEQIK